MELENVLMSFFYMQQSRFPSTSYWRDHLFFILQSCLLCCRLIDHKCLGLFLGFLFCSIDLLSVFVPIPYCSWLFDYYSFIVLSEVKKHDTSSFVLFSEHCFDYLGFSALSNQRRQWHPTPVLLPGKSHGWRSLVGCGPWGHWELDTTERLHFHFSLSCIGEGNGNPLQCSCLESPSDGEAWWAPMYRVTQSRTRLKRFSSSSSSTFK